MVSIPKYSQEEINASGIRSKMCEVNSEVFKKLIKEQVDPWFFFNSKGINIKKYDGRDITISGVEFSGSSSQVFWSGYIEPYIEDVIKRMVEETIELAKGKDVRFSAVIDSTRANLSGGIDTVYRKMQEVDRRLRGKGSPESVPKRDISFEIKTMNDFLDRQMKIHEELAFQVPDGWFKKWYHNNPHWIWLTGLIIGSGIIAFIISVAKKLIF